MDSDSAVDRAAAYRAPARDSWLRAVKVPVLILDAVAANAKED